MSDLFHEKVPFEFVDRVFGIMSQARHHIFQVLTKRADRLLSWHVGRSREPIAPHIWLGVSVESPAYLWRAERLREVDACVRFISAEPLLGSLAAIDPRGIAWIITGGESGGASDRALVHRGIRGWEPKPNALQWVRELRDVCRRENIAFFHKQWGGPSPKTGGRELDGETFSEMPQHIHSDRPLASTQ